MNYYMSAGYLDDKGIVPNSGFQRYSARLKADYQVKPWLKMGGNVSFTHYDSREQDTEGGTSNANIFMHQILWEPFILCMFVMHRAILW